MKHSVLTIFSAKLHLLFVAACAIPVYAEVTPKLNWSEIGIDGRTYQLKLTEFAKPVEVGVGSADITDKALDYLRAFAIISDPIKYSYEDACKVATDEATSRTTREKYEKLRTITVRDNPSMFQKSIDYTIEVQPKPAGEKYLVIAYRYGYNLKNVDKNEREALGIMIWEQGDWKTFPPVTDEIQAVLKDLKFEKLDDIKSLIDVAKRMEARLPVSIRVHGPVRWQQHLGAAAPNTAKLSRLDRLWISPLPSPRGSGGVITSLERTPSPYHIQPPPMQIT